MEIPSSTDYMKKLNYSKLVTNFLKDLISDYPVVNERNIQLLKFNIENFLIHQFPNLTPNFIIHLTNTENDSMVKMKIVPQDMITFLCLYYEPTEMHNIFVPKDFKTNEIFKINNILYMFSLHKEHECPIIVVFGEDDMTRIPWISLTEVIFEPSLKHKNNTISLKIILDESKKN